MAIPVIKCFLLFFAAAAPLVTAQAVPTIYGVLRNGNTLLVENLTLSREYPRYNVRGAEDPALVQQVVFNKTTLAVFSPDFCDFHENIQYINASDLSLEVVLPGAFDKCPGLSTVIFTHNLIKEIPAGLFKNTASLTTFNFDFNKLETLPDNLLDGSRTNLGNLYLRNNNFREFPAKAFNKVTGTRFVYFTSNDATDLRAEEFFDAFPDLYQVYIGDNLLPCSRLPGIVTEFWEKPVYSRDGKLGFKPREREIKWSTYDSIPCVDE